MSAKSFGVLVVAVALVVGGVLPASAEFFGCNEPRTKVSYSNAAYRSHYARAYAPPRQRRVTYTSNRRMASQWRSSQWH
jgi:hypothetical protein